MIHASLFSGIGGFDLASQWMNWQNVFNCEINEFCRKILKYYWPKAIQYGDIKTTDFEIWKGKIDILTGGFPCQPYSTAGKRKGKEDDRHLWPEMLRAISEIQPVYIVGENVPGIINWSNGLVFDEVQTEMENEGYEIWPFILPASAVNAPHRRDRVWFIAYSVRNGFNIAEKSKERFKNNREWFSCNDIEPFFGFRDASNTKKQRFSERNAKQTWEQPHSTIERHNCMSNWENFPTQSPICSRNDGFPAGLDGITFPKWRNESIKGLGNAIVPQVALQIFKAIELFNINIRSESR